MSDRVPTHEPSRHLHVTIEDGVVTRRAVETKLGDGVIELNGQALRARNISITEELDRGERTWTGEVSSLD